MRLSRLWWLALPLSADGESGLQRFSQLAAPLTLNLSRSTVVQGQREPVQLTFGVTEGAQLRQPGQAGGQGRGDGGVPLASVENDDNEPNQVSTRRCSLFRLPTDAFKHFEGRPRQTLCWTAMPRLGSHADSLLLLSSQPLVVHFASGGPASPNHDHLYQLAVSLLDSLTAHSPPAPPTAYSPHLAPTLASSANAVSVALDKLQAKLNGTVTGAAFSRTRAVVGRVGQVASGFVSSVSSSRSPRGGAAARKSGGGSNTENLLRAVVAQIKAVLGTGATTPARGGSASQAGRGDQSTSAASSGSSWKDRIGAAAALKGEYVVLSDEEIAEGWREVVDLAQKAAEAGSVDALVLLGNLYLVGRPPLFLLASFEAVLMRSSIGRRSGLGRGSVSRSRVLHARVGAVRVGRSAVQARLPVRLKLR